MHWTGLMRPKRELRKLVRSELIASHIMPFRAKAIAVHQDSVPKSRRFLAKLALSPEGSDSLWA